MKTSELVGRSALVALLLGGILWFGYLRVFPDAGLTGPEFFWKHWPKLLLVFGLPSLAGLLLGYFDPPRGGGGRYR